MKSNYKIPPESKNTIPIRLVLVFILFSALIIIAGLLYYRSQKERIFREQGYNLSAIAQLKIEQIEQWHSERMGDAEVIKENKPLIRTARQFFNTSNKELRNELNGWMKSVCTEYDYSNVLLLDTTLNIRLSVVPSEYFATDAIGKELKDVLKYHIPILIDLHRSVNIPYIHLDIIIPLIDPESNDSVPVGLAILRVNPYKILFPLIQKWPTPSKTGETLIVRSEGDSVLYLNELRHKHNTALKLSHPLTQNSLLAVKAVKGNKGVVEGMDYRNIAVVGYISDISGLPWFMVAKIDKEELQAPVRRFLIVIMSFMVLLVVINAALFVFWIWEQRVKSYREQYLNEIAMRESESRFTAAFQMSPVSISIISMRDNKFIDVNNAFLDDLEFTREEVIGRTSMELEIWADESERQWIIDEFTEKEKISGKVLNFRTKTGKTLIGLSSMSVIKVNGLSCNLSTVINITGRIKSEEELREKNEYLSNLYNYANTPIIVWDTSLLITQFNHAFEVLSGFSKEEVIGKKIDILFSEEQTEFSLQLINRAIKGKRWEAVEIEIETKDRESRIVLWNSSNILDKDGKNVVATIAQGNDITERKRSEEALRKSEQMYRAIGESINYGVWVCAADGRNTYASDSFLNLVGITQEQCSNFGWGDLLHPDDVARTLSAWKECIRVGGNWDIEHRFRGADTEWHHILARGVPIFDDKGSITAWAGINLDITNLKNAEAALRESEDKFKFVFDYSLIGKSITLPNGEIQVNQAFCEITGYTHDELKKERWQDITYPEDLKVTEEIMHSILNGEKDSAYFTKRYLHKNGSIIWTEVGTYLRRDDNGNPLYFITSINNITEKKKAEEELYKLNQELEQRVTQRTEQLQASNKEMESFSYSVSHDLRAPLRAVHGYSRILLEDYKESLDDEGKRICGIISFSAIQMGELIDDLLSFSKIGKSSLNPVLLDMKAMAGNVFAEITDEKEKAGIHLKINKLHKALGDSTLLKLVWRNLLSNAIKYTSKESAPAIEIGSIPEGSMITYFIKDNGVGFDMQYKHKLFGVFQRLHSENEFEGNGVGLAIIQRIILRHGGRVRAEGEVGKGATFYFSLPNQD